MARKTITVMVSDLTGQDIPDERVARVVVTANNSRYVADVDALEVDEIISKGRKTRRSGRKPKTAS